MKDVAISPASPKHYAAMMKVQDLVFADGWSTMEDFAKKCELGGALIAWIDKGCKDGELEEVLLVEDRYVVGFQVFFPPGSWKPNGFADMAPCSMDKWKELKFENLALGKGEDGQFPGALFPKTGWMKRFVCIRPCKVRQKPLCCCWFEGFLPGRGIGEKLFKASFELARNMKADGMLSHVRPFLFLCWNVAQRSLFF